MPDSNSILHTLKTNQTYARNTVDHVARGAMASTFATSLPTLRAVVSSSTHSASVRIFFSVMPLRAKRA